jgi:hypothetical protein
VLDPRTGKPIALNPTLDKGIVPTFSTANGVTSPTGASVLPGYAGANAAIAGAEQRAKQGNTVFSDITGPGGAKVSAFGSDLFGGGGASAAPAPQPNPAAIPPALTAPRVGAKVVSGPTNTEAVVQKHAADQVAAAPQAVMQSKQAVSGLEHSLQILDQIGKSGQGTARTVNVLAYLNNLGIPLMKDDVNGYQTLMKYLSNSLNTAAAGTNASGSDARFESFSHGQPNAANMNYGALRNAIQYVLSQNDASVARNSFLVNEMQRLAASGDPNAAINAQKNWANAYKPQYFEIARMDPKEQATAVGKMSKAEAQSFLQYRQQFGLQ